PPLPGFFGKFYLFSAALNAGAHHGLLWLIIVALFGSLISLYYYLVILRLIFTGRTVEAAADYSSLPTDQALQTAAVCLVSAAVVFLGIVPDALVSRILAALP